LKESVSTPAGPQRPVRRLDRKLSNIAAGRYTPDDFVIADAKDADMAFGVTAAGPVTGAPAGEAGPGRYRTRTEFLDAMRALVAQGELASAGRFEVMKKLIELLVCFIHPLAVVLMWIDLATRTDMTRGRKLVWAIFGLIPLVPFLYVLTSGDLW
jgi:hypothetical protein